MNTKIKHLLKAVVLRQILSIIVVMFLFVSITPAVFAANEENTVTIDVSFSDPTVNVTYDGYLELLMDGTSGYVQNEGEPELPISTIVREFPYGTEINDVGFTPSSTKTMTLPEDTVVSPGPIAVPLLMPDSPYKVEVSDDPTGKVYDVDALYYPYDEGWFEYTVGVGRSATNELVTRLVIHVCPVQYNPVSSQIQYINGGTIHFSNSVMELST